MGEKSKLLKKTKEKYDILLEEAKKLNERDQQEVMQREMYKLKMRHNEKCQEIVKIFRTTEEKEEVARLLREARKEYEHEKQQICPEENREDQKESLSRNARILAKRCEDSGENTDAIRRRQRLDYEKMTTSSAQFICSECQATFDTRKKCMNHKADVHSAKENQSRGAKQKNEADRIELPQDEGGDRENEWQASSSPWATAPPSGRRAHGIYEHFDDCPDDPKYSICKHCGRKVCDESNIFDMWTLLA